MWRSLVNQCLDVAYACDELAGDFFCCKISPSSHFNSHSSHLSGHLLLLADPHLARELLWVQQYSHSLHFHGLLPVWEGLESKLWKVGKGHGVQFSQWTTFYGKCNKLKTSFFTFSTDTDTEIVISELILCIKHRLLKLEDWNLSCSGFVTCVCNINLSPWQKWFPEGLDTRSIDPNRNYWGRRYFQHHLMPSSKTKGHNSRSD